MKLYLFNPENDVALVHGRRRFTMSPQVARLHDDGAMLPVWYAGEGDMVLAPGVDSGWLNDMRGSFRLHPEIVESCHASCQGSPWGWSFDAARQLSAAGASVLDENRLEGIAAVSHRRVSIEIMSRLQEALPFRLPPVPVEITTLSELGELVADAPVYVKAPWSSSGRGVFRVTAVDDRVAARVNGIFRRQGSVIVERSLDKKCDFAMLFHTVGGKVEWVGYSLFFNSTGDAYGGNVLASDDMIEDTLVTAGASREHLHAIRSELTGILAGVIDGVYEGYFGVDMLVTTDGMVAPCVELNLRMTMGVVSHILVERHLASGVTGIYRVMHGLPTGVRTPVVRDHRLVEGTVFLTPPSPDSFNFVMETCDYDMVSRCLYS